MRHGNVKRKFLNYFLNKSKLFRNMCSFFGLSQGLAVASALRWTFLSRCQSSTKEVRSSGLSKQQPQRSLGPAFDAGARTPCEQEWHARAVCQEGAGRRSAVRGKRLETSNHPPPLHVHKLSLTVSPICTPASNLSFCGIGK